MKNILFGIGGFLVGALLGGVVWSVGSVILFPLLQGLFTLGLAAGGAYFAYNYAKNGEFPRSSDWKD